MLTAPHAPPRGAVTRSGVRNVRLVHARARGRQAASANPAGFRRSSPATGAPLARTPTSFRGRDLHQPALEIQVRPTSAPSSPTRMPVAHSTATAAAARTSPGSASGSTRALSICSGEPSAADAPAPWGLKRATQPGAPPPPPSSCRPQRMVPLRGRHVGQRRGQLKVGRVVVHVEASQPAEVVAQRRAAQTGRLPVVAKRHQLILIRHVCHPVVRASGASVDPRRFARFAAPTEFEPCRHLERVVTFEDRVSLCTSVQAQYTRVYQRVRSFECSASAGSTCTRFLRASAVHFRRSATQGCGAI